MIAPLVTGGLLGFGLVTGGLIQSAASAITYIPTDPYTTTPATDTGTGPNKLQLDPYSATTAADSGSGADKFQLDPYSTTAVPI